MLGKKYLIHDRDPLFNKRFDSVFESIGIEIKKITAVHAADECSHGEFYSGDQDGVFGQDYFHISGANQDGGQGIS